MRRKVMSNEELQIELLRIHLYHCTNPRCTAYRNHGTIRATEHMGRESFDVEVGPLDGPSADSGATPLRSTTS